MTATELDEPFLCGGCGEMTTRTHWRNGADGAMFHASADAPPSDPAPPQDHDDRDR